MPSLADTIAALTRESDEHVIEAPAEWAQGRTLYGGMTAALCYRAATRDHDGLPPLRSAQFSFIGPATGRIAIRTAELRRGRSSAVIGVDCRNGNGLAARTELIFGEARASAITHERVTVPTGLPEPEACGPLHRTSKPLPGHLGRFDFRQASIAALFQLEAQPDLAVWARFREDAGSDPIVALLAMADALPAAAMVNFPKPAPVSTMTWSIDLHRPIDRLGEWNLVCSSSESAADGYSLQSMRVFARDGTPIASGRQMVALFA